MEGIDYDEIYYIVQPTGFGDGSFEGCILFKDLYGLKIAMSLVPDHPESPNIIFGVLPSWFKAVALITAPTVSPSLIASHNGLRMTVATASHAAPLLAKE